ncbi:MAG: ATP-binding cassette domain-containing protein, partial [Alphaproteobacteria bacterium]
MALDAIALETAAAAGPLLAVSGLSVVFATRDGPLAAIEDVSYDLARGRTLGIVGESGSGKTVLALARR